MSYIVSECNTVEEVLKAVCQDTDVWCEDIQVVKTDWLSACIKAGCIQAVAPNHLIPHAPKTSNSEVSNFV